MVNQKDQIVKISPAFLERMIDAVCYPALMYKVELRDGGKYRGINQFVDAE